YTLTNTGEGALGVFVTRTLAIYGAGVGNTIIRSALGWHDRLLGIDFAAHVVISGITIQNANPGSGNGGLILNGGSLQLTNVILKNAGANQGGGIYNAGRLSVDNSVVFNNGATEGGGIYNSGVL